MIEGLRIVPAEVASDIADLGELIGRAAYEMGLSRAEIVGPSREARLFRARAAVAWVARVYTQLPLIEIARALGRRDHVCVVNQVRRAEALRGRDPAFARLTNKLLIWLEQGE